MLQFPISGLKIRLTVGNGAIQYWGRDFLFPDNVAVVM